METSLSPVEVPQAKQIHPRKSLFVSMHSSKERCLNFRNSHTIKNKEKCDPKF